MELPKEYKVLNKNTFELEGYKIVPIRFQDSLDIMNWRNEQMYHLRQTKKLTREDQNYYFENIISKLFDAKKPDQILFSLLKDNTCIGYGGLVHINWTDKNAEISFIMASELEQNDFEINWHIFLELIEKVAFNELLLHKIFTYAFDLRPNLYKVLENYKFKHEATLKEHCLFNGNFIDVVIHHKKNFIHIREVNRKDVQLLFDWSNDKLVRTQSYNSDAIEFKKHTKWFNQNYNSSNSLFLILEINNIPFGIVRFTINGKNAVIGISISKNYRGICNQ